MKNKKGFTLIELLAVIVILAIIALIATPIVINMVNSAKKSAAKSSALGYIEAIEYNNGLANLGTDANLPETYTKITSGRIEDIDINVKGKKPVGGEITVDENGKVTEATLCIGVYEVEYDGKDAEVGDTCQAVQSNFGGEIDKTTQLSSASVPQKGLIGVAYLDPTNLETECSKDSTLKTPFVEEATCMKFYIYGENGNKYKMILDHNTTTDVAWNSTGSNASMLEIASQLATDTEGWIGNPRLITADEIAEIIGAKDALNWSSTTAQNVLYFDGSGNNASGWGSQVVDEAGASSYAWLYDYTGNGGVYQCTLHGCSVSTSGVTHTYGYWTSTPVASSDTNVWIAYYQGVLTYGGASLTQTVDSRGIRPVIEVSKSLLK